MTENLSISTDVNLDEMSEETEGFTGADIKSVLYSARQNSLQRSDATDHSQICRQDLLEAIRETKPSVSSVELQKYNSV